MDPEESARTDVAARYGLDKDAGFADSARQAAGAVGRGAEWLFSRHPNTATHKAWGVTGHKPGPPGWWDKVWGRNVGKGAPIYGVVDKAGRGPGFTNFVKDFGHTAGEFVRDWNLGSPVDMAREMRAAYRQGGGGIGGAAHAVGDQYRNYYWHPEAGGLMNMVGVGLTGYDLYSAVTGDASQRKGDLASAAAGAAIAPFTGRLGSVVGMPIHMAATAAARRWGHQYDAPKPEAAPALPFTPQYDVQGHTRRWLRTNPMGAAGHAAAGAGGFDAGFPPADPR